LSIIAVHQHNAENDVIGKPTCGNSRSDALIDLPTLLEELGVLKSVLLPRQLFDVHLGDTLRPSDRRLGVVRDTEAALETFQLGLLLRYGLSAEGVGRVEQVRLAVVSAVYSCSHRT
jgi:hypothetical protein